MTQVFRAVDGLSKAGSIAKPHGVVGGVLVDMRWMEVRLQSQHPFQPVAAKRLHRNITLSASNTSQQQKEGKRAACSVEASDQPRLISAPLVMKKAGLPHTPILPVEATSFVLLPASKFIWVHASALARMQTRTIGDTFLLLERIVPV
ncbi:unnamed protein product [Hydatigera taeniaeformis]|uniref:Uncharacterized protein n=1 Tax=Hydatigena taeniaeformis TaxID=6205 RepID=A0A0R3WV17_HYDTA|nr:unnamed protein product [Hydatigera taeniaeformis]